MRRTTIKSFRGMQTSFKISTQTEENNTKIFSTTNLTEKQIKHKR